MDRAQRTFENRTDAGRQLGARLKPYQGRNDLLVLALPRGGLPVGLEVARALSAPLDVMIVRKLGTPGQPELAMGAIAPGGVRVVNADVVRQLRISAEQLDEETDRERVEVERREKLYRAGRGPLEIAGRTVILVDDGIATGATMRAAIQALRAQRPTRLVVAVPTAAPSTAAEIRHEVDDFVCLSTPDPFFAIGYFYRDFPQLTDDEVRRIIAEAGPTQKVAPPTG